MAHETGTTSATADRGAKDFTVRVRLEGFQLKAVEAWCKTLGKDPDGFVSELVGAAVTHLAIAGAGHVKD